MQSSSYMLKMNWLSVCEYACVRIHSQLHFFDRKRYINENIWPLCSGTWSKLSCIVSLVIRIEKIVTTFAEQIGIYSKMFFTRWSTIMNLASIACLEMNSIGLLADKSAESVVAVTCKRPMAIKQQCECIPSSIANDLYVHRRAYRLVAIFL